MSYLGPQAPRNIVVLWFGPPLAVPSGMAGGLKSGVWGLWLSAVLAACGPSVESGEGEGEGGCRSSDAPIACVGHDGFGCLSQPRGEAECVDGRWICEQEWTAPQVDTEAYCTVPPVEDCEGEPVLCTDQSVRGECSDAINDAYAFCMGGQWECPAGFHDEEVRCTWPEYPEPVEPEDPRACAPGDTPPWEYADCWDQGPGECADATQLPSCEQGQWECPPGWDFGGFGDGCTWPEWPE